MEKQKGMAEVTTQHPDGHTELETHSLESPPSKKSGPVEVPYAEVEYGFGGTIATALYENVKIWASVRLPAKVTEIDGVFDFAVSWVDDKLAAKHAEIAKLYGL